MGNVHKVTEHERSTYGGFSNALGGETSDTLTTPTFVSMANYDLVTIRAHASGVASDSVLTLKAWEATASGGGGSQTLTHSLSSDTFTSTNTTDTDVLEVQVRGEDLSAGFIYVGAKLVTSNASGTEKVGMIVTQLRARYKQASLPA